MNKPSDPRHTGVQSVHRAVQLITALGDTERGATLTELSARTGLHKTTVHRLLATLKDAELVRYADGEGRYALGTGLLRLGDEAKRQLLPGTAVRSVLLALRDETGETTHLGVPNGRELVYADKVDSTGALRIASRIGARLPLHCTAMGKCYIAFQPQAEIEAYLASATYERRTAQTVTTAEGLRAQLKKARREGYAIDDRENETEMRCVGAPIVGPDGFALGAVSVSAPVSRLPWTRVKTVTEAVVRAAAEISSDLLGSGTG